MRLPSAADAQTASRARRNEIEEEERRKAEEAAAKKEAAVSAKKEAAVSAKMDEIRRAFFDQLSAVISRGEFKTTLRYDVSEKSDEEAGHRVILELKNLGYVLTTECRGGNDHGWGRETPTYWLAHVSWEND